MNYEVVIGIEVHAQLKTNTKIFCNCSTQFGEEPNANTCPVCLGFPGVLPVLNKKVVEMAILAGTALNCQINQKSTFARKNYFYPDLPKAYQISQFEEPICGPGHLDIKVDNENFRIGITRIHLEEDAGKLVHQGASGIVGADSSLVNLNRAGVPLIEIVSDPDIRTPAQARAYVESLKQILQFIGVSDGNLEEGSLRADANISLRKVGETTFGTKTEIKNVNSFRNIERALKSEIARQEEVLRSGGTITQQTRHYDEATQKTHPLRSKEESHDYRYFPDPDLIPLILNTQTIEDIRSQLPELPADKRIKFKNEYDLNDEDISILLNNCDMLSYFEACVAITAKLAKELVKWIIGDLNNLVCQAKTDFENTLATPQKLVTLLTYIESGKISRKMAQEMLTKIVATGADPEKLVSNTASLIADESELLAIIKPILAEQAKAVEMIRAGDPKGINFLVGQVMKATKGRAKPDLVNKLISQEISA